MGTALHLLPPVEVNGHCPVPATPCRGSWALLDNLLPYMLIVLLDQSQIFRTSILVVQIYEVQIGFYHRKLEPDFTYMEVECQSFLLASFPILIYDLGRWEVKYPISMHDMLDMFHFLVEYLMFSISLVNKFSVQHWYRHSQPPESWITGAVMVIYQCFGFFSDEL